MREGKEVQLKDWESRPEWPLFALYVVDQFKSIYMRCMFSKKYDLTTLFGIRGQVAGWMRTKRPTINPTGNKIHTGDLDVV